MEAPVTLITGTRKGIGKALTEHYVRAGHRVIGCSRQAPDWTIEGYEHVTLDVGDEAAVCAMFREIRSRYGRLDHLINNAGISTMNHSILTTIERVHRLLDTNVVGTFLLSREAAKVMQQGRFGRIVNFSSVAVPLKVAGEAAYVASKAAVESLTEILAREYAPYGITVNAVGPVPIETDLVLAIPREKIESLLARQAIPAFATAADVTNVTDFFLSPESSLITGQIVYLGGV